MITSRGKLKCSKETCPVLLRPPQIPHEINRDDHLSYRSRPLKVNRDVSGHEIRVDLQLWGWGGTELGPRTPSHFVKENGLLRTQRFRKEYTAVVLITVAARSKA
jgi:hypothetical protein